MKKYLKLTTNEAIRHFLIADGSFAPETSSEVRNKLDRLSELESKNSVSVVIPTHRTRPDSEKDIILLKNLVAEAEKAVYECTDKRTAAQIAANLHEARDAMDHSINLDGLIIYANEHFSTIVKVPVRVDAEITVGKFFDLRPLYRAIQQYDEYYIISVSRNIIRLFDAYNDKITHEITSGGFPFVNEDYYTDDPEKLKQDDFTENLIKEYFNVSDKRFQKIYNEIPLSLVIIGDGKTISRYESQMDDKRMVIAHVHGSFDNTPLHEIASQVKPVMEQYRSDNEKNYLKAMDNARSAGLFSSDITDIIATSANGGTDVLFLGNSFSMPGYTGPLNGTKLDGAPETNPNENLHNMIRNVCTNGGRIVFLDDASMEEYDGIAMIRRYAV